MGIQSRCDGPHAVDELLERFLVHLEEKQKPRETQLVSSAMATLAENGADAAAMPPPPPPSGAVKRSVNGRMAKRRSPDEGNRHVGKFEKTLREMSQSISPGSRVLLYAKYVSLVEEMHLEVQASMPHVPEGIRPEAENPPEVDDQLMDPIFEQRLAAKMDKFLCELGSFASSS